MNIMVGHGDINKKWHAPTGYYPLAKDGESEVFDPPCAEYLAARYTDIYGNSYSTECSNNNNEFFTKNKYPEWSEERHEYALRKTPRRQFIEGLVRR